ncbi:Imm42 family immunity protein [Paraburkholderia sp. SARCC-3016]|uniref:Imm42 family immunity protein n=1 Tax=Paraburkholderia sp. SARCC-3016 TaxID=3058611 RepID=UPI002809DB57|nr:Imm42 family immunity protein [Paraburkholderia sp. SARCC-3016]MDQ7976766.1 Imm42 family immunity protein [Paraburkholderia sp. SARCC-3016]
MLHGDKARFGIEFELDEHSGGAWMFGKFCYWIGGEQVGDFDEGTSLRDVLFSMRYIIGDAGKRTAPSVASCDGRDIFRVIYGYLNKNGDDLIKLVPTDAMPACFDVCPPVDIFRACHIYLVDTGELSKIVYSSDGGCTVKAVELAAGEFDGIASTVYGELNQLLGAKQE